MKGDGNLWWSGAVNMGARYAIEDLQTDYLLLWNNDIKVERNYFSKLPDIIRRNGKDTIIGSKVLVEEDTSVVWSMGGFFDPGTGKHGMFGYFKQDSDEYSKVHKADWLTGMGTVVPAEAVRTVGYWDSENFPQYHGDSDFTYRAKLKGYELIVDPGLVIYNSTKSSGIEHDGSFKKLLKLFTDTRSKSNFKRNFRFYKLYATSVRAYIPLLLLYVRIFLGFFKWKFLHFFGTERR
jgi:GT2 family glycosyltransferase